MSKLTFSTHPIALRTLLEQCHNGQLQLPDFQRSWVWEEDRIKSLIASVSRGFPVGALMTLKTQMDGSTSFAHRGIQGTALPQPTKPHELLLDGQQRMTSLYQTCMRQHVVSTITAKKYLVDRWFYIDIKKAMDSDEERDSAIIGVPKDRKLKTTFDKVVVLDLSTPELEYEQLMFPLNKVFDHNNWMQGFWQHWQAKGRDRMGEFFDFQREVLNNITGYQIPVISLGADTSHEAVCVVFEKVNTGGKALDAFELLTAMYAADGHKLRNDWLGINQSERDKEQAFDWMGSVVTGQDQLKRGIQSHFAEYLRSGSETQGVLAKVASTDFLQAIALLHGREMRLAAEAAHPDKESEWPAVRATRQALLDLPLDAYKKYCSKVVNGFERAAQLLLEQHIYRVIDIPYQSQLVPLAAIFAVVGDINHATVKAKITRWFWCGVFGELYGSAIESRFAKDIMEVPGWLADHGNQGPVPTTVAEGVMRPERLRTMRSRLSAAYKGIHALLMQNQARDFRSGQSFGNTVFFQESVDIHHIFPKKWCESEKQKIPASVYDSVINKTPLTARTNRIIQGDAPSAYLAKLEDGSQGNDGYPPLAQAVLDAHLTSHMIPVALLRADDFYAFMDQRQRLLMNLIGSVTHNAAPETTSLVDADEMDEDLPDDIARDSGIVVAENV